MIIKASPKQQVTLFVRGVGQLCIKYECIGIHGVQIRAFAEAQSGDHMVTFFNEANYAI